MSYAIWNAARDLAETECKAAGRALDAVPGVGSGTMGLTPDSVKSSPEYRAARARWEEAFATLRRINAEGPRLYRKEMKAERRARHA